MKIQTYLSYQEVEHIGEVNNLPSETQPDEVLSIREMLENHVRGLPVSGSSGEGVYLPEEVGYVPDLRSLDLTEIEDLRDQYALSIDETKKKLAEADKAAKELAVQKAEEERQDKEALKAFRKSQKSGEADKPPVSGGQ